MPIQVLPPARDFASEFGASIGGGLGSGFSQGFLNSLERNQQLKNQKLQGETLRKLTGQDLSGLDAATQKTLAAELIRQQGKESRLNQQQSYLGSLLGSQEKQESPNLQTEDKLLSLSDEDIIKAENMGIKGLREAKNAKISKSDKQKELDRKQFESDRAFHSQVSRPIIKAAENIVREAPTKKGLIDQQRRDIASGNVEGIFPFLVDELGLEMYRNPESSRFKTANKERFVSSVHELGGAGARPNQFIEQQLTQAQAALGRSAEANESVLDLQEFMDDAKLKRAELELNLANEDREKLGYAKEDISTRADKLMKPIMEQLQDEMAYKIRSRREQNMSDDQLAQDIVMGNIVPDTPLTLRTARFLMLKNNDDEKKAFQEAKKLGFKIPLESTYRSQ